MKLRIDFIKEFLEENSRRKEWIWFLILVAGGMVFFLAIVYPIKLLVRGLM